MNVTEPTTENGGQSPPLQFSCKDCAAMPVCRLLAAVVPLTDDLEKAVGAVVVNPAHLANICQAFFPKEAITVNFEPAFPVDTKELPEVAL